jgi:5,10-methylenetetrahydromethanopterin reductase
MAPSTGSKPSVEFQLGLGMAALDYGDFRRRAAAAEAGGFAFVSVGDNPGQIKDTYVSLAVLADATETCRIGTSITTTAHRDPLVVASAASAVESLAPGRVFLGIATGRARKPAPLSALEEHVSILRALWNKEEVTYRGETMHLMWDAKPVPILVCTSGPRGLRLAGRIADGVIIESGVTPEVVQQSKRLVAEGARAAGRDPSSLELWWYVKAAIADSHDEATAIGRAALAASGALVVGKNPEARGVPERFQDQCRTLAAKYDMRSHIHISDDDPNRKLTSDPEFLAYLIDRFGLIGTPDQWVKRIGELRARGIDNVFCAAVVPDMDRFIDLVAGEVLPKVR